MFNKSYKDFMVEWEIFMITIREDEISKIICEPIEQYNMEVKIINTGTII